MYDDSQSHYCDLSGGKVEVSGSYGYESVDEDPNAGDQDARALT